MRRQFALCTLTLALAACSGMNEKPDHSTASAPAAAAQPATAASTKRGSGLEDVLAGSHRDEASRARDGYRHPQQTLDFFGLEPDMSVIEITPGLGWYADVLGPWLNPQGHYIAAIWDDTIAGVSSYYANANTQLRAKFAANPALFGNAKLIAVDSTAPDFSAGAPADAILTFRNVHNWTQAGNDGAWFKAFYAALKPGGVLGVVDHRAKPGTTLEATMKTGYLTEEYVIGLATAAGFVLEEKSEINANPMDTTNHPSGVWTLPPTLALKDKDREKYLAIGESDRMTLRFRKPGDSIHTQKD